MKRFPEKIKTATKHLRIDQVLTAELVRDSVSWLTGVRSGMIIRTAAILLIFGETAVGVTDVSAL